MCVATCLAACAHIISQIVRWDDGVIHSFHDDKIISNRNYIVGVFG